jgi:hypothetical protein
MGTLKRIAPIFPVSDINLSLEYYGRLGFDTRAYEKGGYGYVTCDGIEVHIGLSPQVSRSPPSSAYLWVEDADELAQKWTSRELMSDFRKTPTGESTKACS